MAFSLYIYCFYEWHYIFYFNILEQLHHIFTLQKVSFTWARSVHSRECISQRIWSGMHDMLVAALIQVRMCCLYMTYTKTGQYDFRFSYFFCSLVSILSNVGLISSNLFSLLLFQHCLCCRMNLFSFLKSVKGILNIFSVVMFRGDLAALSTWLFLLIPVWLGTQHIFTSSSFDKCFNLHRIFIINGLSNFLFFFMLPALIAN